MPPRRPSQSQIPSISYIAFRFRCNQSKPRCSSRTRSRRNKRPSSERAFFFVFVNSSASLLLSRLSASARGNQTRVPTCQRGVKPKPTRARGSLISRLPGIQVSISGAVPAHESAVVMPAANRQPMIGRSPYSPPSSFLCVTPHRGRRGRVAVLFLQSRHPHPKAAPGSRNRLGARLISMCHISTLNEHRRVA